MTLKIDNQVRPNVFPLVEGIDVRDAGKSPIAVTCAAVPELDCLDGVLRCFFQNAFADGPDDEAEKPAPKVFTVAYNHDINIGCPVGMTGEGVGVARCASP